MTRTQSISIRVLPAACLLIAASGFIFTASADAPGAGQQVGAFEQAIAPAPDKGNAAPATRPALRTADALPVKALSLSPAVIMTRGIPGQSVTQTLTINNQTAMGFSFEMIAQDVIVRDEKRVFVQAGELPHSIAATAVFSRKTVSVPSGQTASVDVTVTLTPNTPIRAIVAVFHGLDRLEGQGKVGMTASLGCLITFTASGNFAVTPAAIQVKPQSATRPLTITLPLANTGTEPVIPEGVVAFLSDSGKLVGKAQFTAQRLLPGERLEFTAEYPSQLRSGHYRAVTSFQFEDRTLSNTTEFMVE